MKDKLDDEIKLTGLESLVPEELEKHLILNSNRLRTFEDARLEVVTYVEAKFGLIIRDSKPSDTGVRGHSDPKDVDAVNSLSSGKGKGSSSPRDGFFFKCGGAHFQRDCNARKSTGKQSSGKGKKSKSWSKSEGKGKSEENKGKSKGKSKGAKGSHKGKTSKTGLSGLENSKSEASPETQESAQMCPTDTSWNDGWNGDDGTMAGVLMNGMMTGDPLDGTKVGKKRTTLPQAHFRGGFDVSATSSPKRFEWVKMNLDTEAAVNTFPLNFGPERAGDGKILSDCQW